MTKDITVVYQIPIALAGLLGRQSLHAIERSSTKTLVLDVTGVPVVDAQVAQGLLGTMQACRLLGVDTILVGIRPEVAQAIVSVGINLQTVQTFSNLQSALSHMARQSNGGRQPRQS